MSINFVADTATWETYSKWTNDDNFSPKEIVQGNQRFHLVENRYKTVHVSEEKKISTGRRIINLIKGLSLIIFTLGFALLSKNCRKNFSCREMIKSKKRENIYFGFEVDNTDLDTLNKIYSGKKKVSWEFCKSLHAFNHALEAKFKGLTKANKKCGSLANDVFARMLLSTGSYPVSVSNKGWYSIEGGPDLFQNYPFSECFFNPEYQEPLFNEVSVTDENKKALSMMNGLFLLSLMSKIDFKDSSQSALIKMFIDEILKDHRLEYIQNLVECKKAFDVNSSLRDMLEWTDESQKERFLSRTGISL